MIPSSLIPGLRLRGVNLAQTDTVYLYTPQRVECSEANCGPNEATGGGLDPSCAVCGGTGWEEVTMVSVLKCRVRWWYGPDASFAASSGLQSGEVGDLSLSFDPKYQAALDEAYSNSKSYLEVNGFKVKMLSMAHSMLNGVITSIDVQCNLNKEDRDGQADFD